MINLRQKVERVETTAEGFSYELVIGEWGEGESAKFISKSLTTMDYVYTYEFWVLINPLILI